VIRRDTFFEMTKLLRAIRIEPSDLKELERLAKKDDRTVSYLIQRAIREFIRRKTRKAA
jgi:predicted transcriptional regulator